MAGSDEAATGGAGTDPAPASRSPLWLLMLGALVPALLATLVGLLIFDHPSYSAGLGLMFGVLGGVFVDIIRRERGAAPGE